MKIVEDLLATEDYVNVDPKDKNSLEYQFTYKVKEEIRSHKWNRGTEGVTLTWAQAKNEWFEKHYEGFLKHFVKSLKKCCGKPKKEKNFVSGFQRRDPVVTGGIL